MPAVFWTGHLTLPMLLMVDANNLLALVVGNAPRLRRQLDAVDAAGQG